MKRYILIGILALALGACSTVSADLKADISAQAFKEGEKPSERIIQGFQDAYWNLTEATRVGALLADDPAPGCVKSILVKYGADPDGTPVEPKPSFTPRINGPISLASVAYIRIDQARRLIDAPRQPVSAACKQLIGEIVIAGAEEVREAVVNVPVVRRILD